jgi:hypothetical protein
VTPFHFCASQYDSTNDAHVSSIGDSDSLAPDVLVPQAQFECAGFRVNRNGEWCAGVAAKLTLEFCRNAMCANCCDFFIQAANPFL